MLKLFRAYVALIAMAFFSTVLSPAWAQDFPNKPIHLVVPFGPGGATDIVGRVLAEKMSDILKQPVIVENRSGAGGLVGTTHVMRSEPDGHTLLMATIGFGANPALFGDRLPFDPVKDFTPVSMLVNVPTVLVVHPSVPARSAKELVELAMKEPGTLNFGSAGYGTVNHLAGEMMKFMADIDMVHIPYRSGSASSTAVVAGEISMLFATTPTALPFIASDRLIPLAASGVNPLAQLPDVPLLQETIPGFNVVEWQGVVGPAGIPRPVVDKLNAAIVEALHDPAVTKRLIELGTEVVASSPEELAAHVKSEVDRWNEVSARTGMTAKD